MSNKSLSNKVIHSAPHINLNHSSFTTIEYPKRHWDHNNRRFIHYHNNYNYPDKTYIYYDSILPYDYDNVYAYPDCNPSLYSYCIHNSNNFQQCHECIKFIGGSNSCAIKNCSFFNNY